ncbi:MAG: bifunctional methylenetetrahydrofolate dehydrogenase/methenyltetrahydrofolate cyclohydrolase [Thermoplasmata archaeon]|nr:MAG: bifunctional methylenetetrahydrofolate dehydrogenase/methenyltetrahydrofolate cyclohydrolase [Thermoplasmata archaeon]
MTAEIIDGKKIAYDIHKSLAREIKSLRQIYGIPPHMATVKIGGDPSSDLYLRRRDDACRQVGIKTSYLEFPKNISEDSVLDSIYKLNLDESIHGILIQFPIPDHISESRIMDAIAPWKDVEGFNPYNMGRTLAGDEDLVPCTPLSVITILEHEHIDVRGMDVVVVNHSNVVGKPLAALLLNRDASVSICHVFTHDLKQYSCKADVLITATGVPRLIGADHVKKNAVVIDVGIVKTEKGICGDVDFDSVKKKASIITPVPGGVGPVTIACCLKNMVKTFKKCMEKRGV